MRTPIFATLILLFGITSTYAQEEFSLEECIFRAIEYNLDIKDGLLNQQFTELDYRTALEAKYPSLVANSNINWNYGRSIDPTTNSFSNFTFLSNSYSLGSAVSLYNGGNLRNNVKQSRISNQASEQDIRFLERTIAESTALSFLGVVFAEENLELAKKQLLQSQAQIDQLDALIEIGTRPLNDRIDLEVQILQSEQMIVEAKNSFELNMLQLKQIMQIEPNHDIELIRPENVELLTDPNLISFEEAYEEAEKNSPSIRAEELRLASSEFGIKVAKSALNPSLGLTVGLSTNYSNQGLTVTGAEIVRNVRPAYIDGTEVEFGIDLIEQNIEKAKYTDQVQDNLAYGFGFGLQIPIYNNRINRANVERAKLGKLSTTNNLERVKNNLKISVQQALINARAAKKKLESSQKSLEGSKMSYNNAKKRFDIGATSSFELTSIKTQYESAQITELIDRYDYLFKVKVLDFYMGKPIKL